MEVATTNTHHHNHHHHHQQHQHLGHQLHHPAHRLPMAKAQPQQQQSSLIVSAASDSATRNGNSGGSPRSPFQREVREWQRIDPDTGALLSGRLEADRWINGPLNSYGKISDSQNISQPNGTQHTQRKQLEVLQKRTANGAVQVIRAQTVQTSSSRSWSSSNSNSASTSASASASASPICMQTNAIGGRSILHNHSNSTNNHTNNNNSSKHFHSTLQQHLAEANTHWLQLSPPTIAATVDISEVSTDDDLDKAAATIAETQYIVDDGEIDDDAAGDGNGDSVGGGGGGGVDVDAVPCNYSISRSGSAGSGSGGSKGHALSSSAASSSSTLHSQSSGLLVPDTAPSLKLSNLMKSSSGGSSSSNNSTKLNTHKSAVGKVSLHAIVGSGGGGAAVGDSNNNNKTNNSGRVNNDLTESPKSIATTTKSSSGALSGTKTWQSQPQPQQQRSNARHLEQATLYGQNSNSSKTRVGVADCDDCYAVVADADEPQPRYHQHHLQTQQQLRRQQQQSGGLLSETATPTRRRDLESFRLYGDSTAASTISASATAGAATADDNAKADDLRLSTRQLRRQQQPFGQLSSNALLQRSHSISTDDLSNEWETNEAVAESNEWRRVSKLRRSFQSSSTPNNGANSNKDSAAQEPTSSIRRPYDLPASTVSVSRIRAELESGRRLTTAMRNNHVDLAALESILHGPEKSTDASKRNTLLTAESLKEIRGRLKKLSDESLYKDDFIAYQQPPSADEHIEVQQSVRRKLSTPRLRQLTPEESLEISTPTQQPSSAFKVVGATHKANDNNETLKNLNQKHTSNSLESRQKATRDTSSTEWHSRRKSYGFEKMSPPDSKTMYRMDASTDSGLGRSGELGNWSPTEAAASTAARATVIHFGEPAKTVTSAHYRAGKSPVRRTPDEDLLKRHSIAVDESQYVRDNLRKTSQVHLNGFYEPAEPAAKTTLQLSRFEDNVAECNQGLSTGSTLFQRTQNAQKRVEFCKTEVHFAAESGRVNIVETDGKPPPTNNFRRRRRTTSGPLQTLTKTASTAATTTTAVSTAAATATTASNVTHFGDDHQQRHRTIATSVVAYKASLMEPPTVLNDAQAMPATTSVTVSVQKLSDSQHAEGSRGSYASTTSGVDTTDNENDEIAAIRGILKNKPVKPKPYHLGENIDSADALWGIQLKPVSGGGSSAVGVREKEDSPTAALNKSVAERVRIVEKRHEHSAPNGYSTKINLSLDEPAALRDWPSAGAPKLMTNTDSQSIPNNTNRRPSAQELILQDLREHQRMLDEGLKSTSLIIKTMRSANEFDEAMRRLSIASMESTTMPPIVVPTPMLRSNSYQETVRRYSNTSLESTERELTTQTVVNTSSSAASLAAATISRRLSFESQSAFVTPLSLPPAPLVAPRLKLLGSTEVTVSQQLSQLRRMYDIATQNANDEDTADSADEEVKSYFCPREQTEQSDSGGGTLESSSQEDERAVEYSSGSWSRMKAKRTIWKIEAEERKAVPAVLDKADLPKSNIMSIELHSPQTSLDKRDSFKRNQTPPVAKPRTVSNVSANEHPQIHVATTVKQTADRFTTAEQQRESLKIVKEARGARKLREHELSYFGVPHAHKHDDNETKPKLLPNGNSNTMSMSKRTLPSRQRLTVIGNDDTKSMRRHEANHTDRTTTNTVSETTEAQTKAQTATKWQLLNDKPDLLRHSPIAVEPQLTRRTADVQQRERNSTSVERNKRMSTKELHLEDELNDVNEADDPDEHFYENITNEITPVFKVKSPQPYDRKMDVERDAYILNEMNENADLTMKALSDEAAHKDRRRRRSSLHRRDSKPLETIEEKMHTQKTSDSFIAVKMSRGTLASEAKRHARNDKNTRVRTSSQSSVESCPRARSRSLSSEREYENIRTPKTTRTPSSAATKTQSKTTSKQQHRSSSRESQRSARLPYSSGDEVNPREEQRVRMKSKRSSNTTSGTTGRGSAERRSSNSTKKDTEKHGHHSTTTSSRDVEQRRRAASSTTHASQREERAECVTVPPQQRTASSGRSSSSKRRDDHATSNTATSGSSSGRHSSSRTATEKSRSSANAGVRLLRSLRVGRSTDDAKVSSTEHRASGHRSTSEREREKAHEKEREKESQSKSRGHSTSKTQHHSSSSEHHHRVADTNTHHLAAHSGSMSSKTREHKKSALTAVEKQHERATTPTHSKSSQVINGRHTGQHDGHRKHNDQRRVLHTRPQQNETTSTTTTHRKRSEHSARERK
ncbi:pneumococcal serine-rich repeat protein isoform X2 [Bactrocera tryoni]|uniref:pneumococcal serine-rich repeat protein isoform X2 n=1 Tax=Bactrocera tryoni TaxID=59916 RepID=UPI001A96B14B|nr:pneumococcal serine-rich repeat protein isoform X2 [Bactrocera tryoni]